MPTVVRIATAAHKIITYWITRSTWLRARVVGLIKRIPMAKPASASIKTTTVFAILLMACRRLYSSAATFIVGSVAVSRWRQGCGFGC